MNNSKMYFQSSILGLQIIYCNTHNEKQIIRIGSELRYDYELHINTKHIHLDAPGISEHTPFALFYIKNSNLLFERHLNDIPPDTLVLQYPKNLFNVFTIKEQFEAINSLREVFKNDLYLQKGKICGYIHTQDVYLLENIVFILSNKFIIPEVVYKCICLISRIILKKTFNTNYQIATIHPTLTGLEKLIESMINDNFNYPTKKDIRKFTNSTKRNFEAQIRSVAPSSLKVFQTELQFKSCLYKIMYTNDSLQDIAMDHGFSEFTAFTRSIKLRTGFSANQLRLKSKDGLLTLLPNLSLYKIITITTLEVTDTIAQNNIVNE